MIDPRTVYVCIPCYKQPEPEVMGSIVACGNLYAALSTPSECSHVALTRNLAVNAFLASPYEWFVGIDADTGFSRQDFELLLEPCDVNAEYWDTQNPLDEGAPSIFTDRARPPRPTRVVIPQPASLRDLDSKTLAAADMVVAAEYSYKNDELRPVKDGMGFVRIHRSVFHYLTELTHDGGPTVEVRRDVLDRIKEALKKVKYPDDFADMAEDLRLLVDTVEDKAGTPRLWQAAWQGRHFYDFFPCGPILSQFVPCAEWMGEDKGFFTLCRLAGIVPRIETRTRLMHIGRKGYPYLGPDGGEGQ